MADTINVILESMLPHLEELQQIGVFEETEIRGIVKRRRQMEYKLFRRPPKKEDYIKAIEYETNLDKLRKLRKERLGVVTSQDGEFGISNRIHGLYRRATKRFKGDVNLWISHIQYARQLNQFGMVGRLYGKVLAVHPTCISLWIMAAKFEFEDKQDASAARVLFQEGLRTNSTSQKLWLEYYRMELLAVDKLRKRRNILVLCPNEELPNDDVIMGYGISSVVYKEAIKAIPNDIQFRLSFLPILSLFEDTGEREQEIFDNLLSDFPHSGLRLNAVAKRNWLKFNDTTVTHMLKFEELECNTELIYRESLKELSSYEVEESILWGRYITWIIERLQYWSEREREEGKDSIISKYGNPCKLLHVCKECASKERLSETLAIDTVQVLLYNGLHQAACELVSQLLSSVYPSSGELWSLKLNCEVFNNELMSTDELVRICKQAISSVSVEVSVQFWQFLLNQAILRQSCSDYVDSLFQECLKSTNSNEDIFVMYLDWGYVVKGIHHVRSFHKRYWLETTVCQKTKIISNCYPSVRIYLKIINQELLEDSVNVSIISKLFEEATYHHGTTSTEIWLSYISTLTHLGGNSIKEVGNVYWRAVRTLDGNLTAQFMSQHCSGIYSLRS